MARIFEHARWSLDCISHKVLKMRQQAGWKTSADLCNDQPIDACGYIAAHVVSRSREAALAEPDSWLYATLPDYSQTQWVDCGNAILHKRDDDRILDSDEVNRLVRHYSYLDQRPQAAEEWWAGAVALDHSMLEYSPLG